MADFHESGWNCCKPRVLTFDEFLLIPPCTTGRHSTIDDTPKLGPPSPADAPEDEIPPLKPVATNGKMLNAPVTRTSHPLPPAVPSPAPPESDSDDPSFLVPPNTTCRRRACNAISPLESALSRNDEECVYHPGQALFHEGSKGWTCCKRRVLEFDEFMKIEGCKRKKRHLFIGSKKQSAYEETISKVRYVAKFFSRSVSGEHWVWFADSGSYRHDFYQTPTSVIASLFLKKIDKDYAKVEFISQTAVLLDLPTADNKRYKVELPLFGHIDPTRSTYKITGTKLEMTLAKMDGVSWPTLMSDEQRTSEIIQVGRAGRA